MNNKAAIARHLNPANLMTQVSAPRKVGDIVIAAKTNFEGRTTITSIVGDIVYTADGLSCHISKVRSAP
jgi:hypothetical protein